MTEACAHRWFIRRESWRKQGWRLRVCCSWCLREQLWRLERGERAVNYGQWRRVHPDPRRQLE